LSCEIIHSCPRCLKDNHTLQECPNKAETAYFDCCKRWRKHRWNCKRTSACEKISGQKERSQSSKRLPTCPRCIKSGHRVRECLNEAKTSFLVCYRQWRFHRPALLSKTNTLSRVISKNDFSCQHYSFKPPLRDAKSPAFGEDVASKLATTSASIFKSFQIPKFLPIKRSHWASLQSARAFRRWRTYLGIYLPHLP
jgi:hypothetical protein